MRNLLPALDFAQLTFDVVNFLLETVAEYLGFANLTGNFIKHNSVLVGFLVVSGHEILN